ncbi:hypothetical protein HanIR_Chr02g0093101 [Helianthus annuus]|nr:hypothetical protein HanIR_Chr02g0093101 [Helianthus annuus]
MILKPLLLSKMYYNMVRIRGVERLALGALLNMWQVWASPVHTQKSGVWKGRGQANVVEGASQMVINTQPYIASHVTPSQAVLPRQAGNANQNVNPGWSNRR